LSNSKHAADEQSGGVAEVPGQRGTSPAEVALDAGRARVALDWYVRCSFLIALAALAVEVLKKDTHSGTGWPVHGIGALVVACLVLVSSRMVVTRGGFKPSYSRLVAQQTRVTLEKASGAGVVVIEATVVSGELDGSFLRPPLVLEDASGLRLCLPVIQSVDGRGRPEALLGDQTNGILYRAGESVVFVGSVQDARLSPTYRGTGSEELSARLDWLAFKGSTREEVVKVLRAREPSMLPIVGIWVLLVVNMVLAVGAWLSR
jgi:hypothetical protein